MKQRTYQYYVIIRNLGKDDEEFIHRCVKKKEAESKLFNAAKSLKDDGDTVYLCHLSVIKKIEKTEDD